ncbi:MAG: TA system VapC family ribonuclease toxin [Actinomycetota bacterium]
MILLDINVLVGALIGEDPNRLAYLRWIQATSARGQRMGLAGVALSGFLRVVTNNKIFRDPATPSEAFGFIRALRDQSRMVTVHPGPRHLQIFEDLCTTSGVSGDLVPDAYLASIALEQGCFLATADRDFARFSGLRVINPLEQ